jgi:hypothetical protein
MTLKSVRDPVYHQLYRKQFVINLPDLNIYERIDDAIDFVAIISMIRYNTGEAIWENIRETIFSKTENQTFT